MGAQGLKNEGVRQNQEGKAQEKEGQGRDLAGGLGDRVTGRLGEGVSALTGDDKGREEMRRRHDDGVATQRSVEKDLERETR